MVSAEISRSWMLVNGSHPEEFDAAAATKADQIVLDIEDAVDPTQKAASRDEVAKWLETHEAWVRINDRSSDFWSDDIDQLRDIPGLLGVMLAKTEDGSHVTETFDRLGGKTRVLALVESALGIEEAREIARGLAQVKAEIESGEPFATILEHLAEVKWS